MRKEFVIKKTEEFIAIQSNQHRRRKCHFKRNQHYFVIKSKLLKTKITTRSKGNNLCQPFCAVVNKTYTFLVDFDEEVFFHFEN